jgi:hypothetical protein
MNALKTWLTNETRGKKLLGSVFNKISRDSNTNPDYKIKIVDYSVVDDELVLTLIRDMDGAEIELTDDKLQSFIERGILSAES